MFLSNGPIELIGISIFAIILSTCDVQSQATNPPTISCSSSQLVCGGRACYDPTTQYCTEFGTIVQCIAACGNQCYNSAVQQCFNGTLCSLGQQLCSIKYDGVYGTPYGSSYPSCYDPKYQLCLNNFLCDAARTCNGRCLGIRQVCADNTTICNVTNNYPVYQANQIKLCNGICYDSANQQCVGGYAVNCILDPFTQQCINQRTVTVITNTASPTTASCISSNCCLITDCTIDADCCVQSTECQCFKHNNDEYGLCLNPNEQPICAKGCSTQRQCKSDTDCCKCKCGRVTVTGTNGSSVVKKQCVPR
ncbi:hypothetical protein I4U23_023218 [Adineta vaga]|nr:hypothetical protein I4U23_023218 [Adineta vaga]